jgi:hypothetical protein
MIPGIIVQSTQMIPSYKQRKKKKEKRKKKKEKRKKRSKTVAHQTPCAAQLTAWSKSASSKTIFGLFPPNSRVTGFKLDLAAASMILRPTIVLPVKATFSIFMWDEMAEPAIGPYPVTRLRTPAGKPASWIRPHMRIAVRGVNSEGYKRCFVLNT